MPRSSRVVRLDRNESPFGTSRAVLRAWEAQRTADRTKYGLNRYPDFFQTDLLAALAQYHELSPSNFTPVVGMSEAGNVLAAALLRKGQLVQSRPMDDPISRPARAWKASFRRVSLAKNHHQALARLVKAVGAQTRLVHLQNPLDPSGVIFDHDKLESFLNAVAEKNPDAYVWVDETYAPYVTRQDFPDSFEILRRDPAESRLVITRSFTTAHGLAGSPFAYIAASQELTEQTEGISNGFFVPSAYGWANPEANIDRMSEKAALTLLSSDRFVTEVRRKNARNRRLLMTVLKDLGFDVVRSRASFVFARAPGRFRDGGLAAALRKQGVLVRGPRGWGRRYRGFVRISVGSDRDQTRLFQALARILVPARKHGGVFIRPYPGSAVAAPIAAAAVLAGAGEKTVSRSQPQYSGYTRESMLVTRRDFVRWGAAGAGAVGLAWSLGRMPTAVAFPPDSFYDNFNLVRMIYHENPVGPSPAALEAVRRVIARGPRAAARYQEEDERDLVDAILRYNHAGEYGLDWRNIIVTLGSGEGLMLAADTFVGNRTLVGEWPAYRIIRERVWQAGGTVVDVPLNEKTWQPDYEALKLALKDHPDVGLVHFNAQNNPIGSVLQKGAFDAFARHVFEHHPRVVILVDESDPEFMDPGVRREMPDFLKYVSRGKKLIHLQTFSHIFGLTGLRVGYLMAPRSLVRALQRKRIARPTNVFGHAAALASLRDRREQIERSWRNCHEGRKYIYKELDKIGLRYIKSQGQYVFFDTGRSGTAVWSLLIGEGVLTRYGQEWGMESWIRVNPGLPRENKRFIASLRFAMGQPDPDNLPTPPFPPDGDRKLARLLAASPARGALARDLENRLRRDLALAKQLPPLVGPYRTVSSADLRVKK